MRCFIAGGAGFIGSNLTHRLLKKGWHVTVFDNLSGGKKEFLSDFFKNGCFKFVRGDLLDQDLASAHIKGHDMVFHLAASSDISLGAKRTDLDLKNGFITTFNILEGMRKNNVKKIIFTSSGSIYGNIAKPYFKEDFGPIFPLSLYAASKVSSEAYISAFSSLYGLKAWIFRLANIVGPNATHGVIFDFIRKLQNNPKNLEILGNGNQTKPYLYVEECIDGMLCALTHTKDNLNYFNLSSNDSIDVKTIAKTVVKVMGLKGVKFSFTSKGGGWPGDQKKIVLNSSKINALGWKAEMTSKEAVCLAAKKILEQRTL
ncbi:MAG: NAD-dependent epimerase/dehydratase family protein [Candidatus Omnitrophota bacterium]